MEQGFLDLAYGVTQEQMTMEQYMGKYYVPFVIWANYPLPGTGPETTSLNFLGQYLLRYAGIAGTPYGDFLWQLQEELPALTFVGYTDAAGRPTAIWRPTISPPGLRTTSASSTTTCSAGKTGWRPSLTRRAEGQPAVDKRKRRLGCQGGPRSAILGGREGRGVL